MGRTRSAALDGARRVLGEVGLRKATMSEVAVRGGVGEEAVEVAGLVGWIGGDAGGGGDGRGSVGRAR